MNIYQLKKNDRCWLLVCGILLMLVSSRSVYGQETIQGKDYKRTHQKALSLIEDGEMKRAIRNLLAKDEKYPGDPETWLMIATAYSHMGKTDEAEVSGKKALKLGIPLGRLFAGQDKLFKKTVETETWKKALNDPSLVMRDYVIHGPMLGRAGEDRMSFWVRTAIASDVQLSVREKGVSDGDVYKAVVSTKAGDDFTGVMTVSGLKANTKYEYWLGKSTEVDGEFKTAPVKGQGAKFKFVFGGGSGYVPPNERAWDTIAGNKPDLLLLLGDNVYSDDPESTLMQEYSYYRRQSRPEFARLVSKTPVYTIWDDHDFSTNDSWGGPEINKPAWKPVVYKTYTQNWVNPYFGGGVKQPGCWHDFGYGDVDFIMLDGRYYREGPKSSKNPSMLGPVQLKWLKERLRASKATIKVIASPVPWDFRTKGGSLDTWNGYQAEREAIFSFIEKEKIDGVVLISADRHRSDAWKIERAGGNSFYEFNSSRLTNQHVHTEMKEAIFSYNKKQSFGMVTIDTTVGDPTIQYDIVTIDGEIVHTLKLKKSQLPSAK